MVSFFLSQSSGQLLMSLVNAAGCLHQEVCALTRLRQLETVLVYTCVVVDTSGVVGWGGARERV